MKHYSNRLKVTAVALGLLSTGIFASCKNSTEPTETPAQQQYDSQAAADVTAAGIGDQSGGAGAILGDAYSLGSGGQVSISDEGGKYHVEGRDTSFDPITMQHSITFTRSRTFGMLTYSGQWVYKYTYFDASGAKTAVFQKGVTDKIEISEVGGHTVTTPRLSTADSSNGNWTLTGLTTASNKMLNGTFNQAGSSTLTTLWNKDRTVSHSFQIKYTNDQITRDSQDSLIILVGSGNSSFTATGPNGGTFTRTTVITFNADGTATLDVTRTSGNGQVDTFTIDVKQGVWIRDGR